MMVKKIHYCWFGGAEKSALIKKCINSWAKHFPDFEIVEWNESNYNVNKNLYSSQAYEAKKYAYVSDVARFDILYEQGGLYFDTDVEVIKPFGELLMDEAFSALETENFIAPGLVMWCKNPGNPIIKEMVDYYNTNPYLDENGNKISGTVCSIFTDIMRKYGFKDGNDLKRLDGFVIYPIDYFCPYDDATGKLTKTKNTYAIHWYAKSWMSKKTVLRVKITRVIHRIFGKNSLKFLKRRKKK
ncbi:MAG: glycosyl transferase [Ruminococcaceae bacterium]|nr:glycosyl transferase [Oscillospiraceae bacterium]